MRITESSLSLASSYSSVSVTEVQERLEIHRPGQRPQTATTDEDTRTGRRRGPWTAEEAAAEGIGRQGRGRGPRLLDQLTTGLQGLAGLDGVDGPSGAPRTCTCGANHVSSGSVKATDDPRLAAIIDLIEKLTGVEFDILDSDELAERLEKAAHAQHHVPGGAPTGDPAPQTTILYDRIETRSEFQSVQVQASAQVTTADGRAINVDLRLNMERAFVERIETHVRIGPPLKDPLVLDLGAGPATIDGGHRAAFDLDADGNLDEVPWVSGGGAFLALDRNGNGVIDDGTELFGARTGDGFGELAALDDDRDGWIDEDDEAWGKLRLVRDGLAVDDTQSLRDAGVGAIAVSSVYAPLTERDAAGTVLGQQRSAGVYLRENGTAGTVRQIDLAF